jgi:hypothetical protein
MLKKAIRNRTAREVKLMGLGTLTVIATLLALGIWMLLTL